MEHISHFGNSNDISKAPTNYLRNSIPRNPNFEKIIRIRPSLAHRPIPRPCTGKENRIHITIAYILKEKEPSALVNFWVLLIFSLQFLWDR